MRAIVVLLLGALGRAGRDAVAGRPDGRTVAAPAFDGDSPRLHLFDLAGGVTRAFNLKVPGSQHSSPIGWSPDDSSVIVEDTVSSGADVLGIVTVATKVLPGRPGHFSPRLPQIRT